MKIYEESETARSSDTEITLGMKSILGIFFGLALICGVFFGFGYSLGRTHTPHASSAALATSPQTSSAARSPVKTVVEPAEGQPKPAAGAPMPAPVLAASDSTTPAPAPQVTKAAYTPSVPASPVPASYPPQSAATPAASIMVQIAAVSRPEDANVLVSALRNLGYNASVHSDPSDKLLHVQIGPFTTRQEALAMRSKLISDGYNAILK